VLVLKIGVEGQKRRGVRRREREERRSGERKDS
jgi:hypothetical protein